MRQYRGLRLDGKGWVYGWYSEYICPEYGNKICTITDAENNEHEVDPKTAGQFIVKEDGAKIFEGDKIEEWKHNRLIREFVAEDSRTFTREYDNSGHNSVWKVTGTIHTKEESDG